MFDLLVVSQEKTIQNIEGFDKSKLKHAETAEKVVSPSESKFMFSVGRKTVVCMCIVHWGSYKTVPFCQYLKNIINCFVF